MEIMGDPETCTQAVYSTDFKTNNIYIYINTYYVYELYSYTYFFGRGEFYVAHKTSKYIKPLNLHRRVYETKTMP